VGGELALRSSGVAVRSALTLPPPVPTVGVDAETGEVLPLNRLTALERAEARGDVGIAGAETSSDVIHALPLLVDGPQGATASATLHMLIAAQRDELLALVREQEAAEAARRARLDAEPMAWRRVRLEREHAIERAEAHRALEAKRAAQEVGILVKARRMGLL
jgi:hypothetical protein